MAVSILISFNGWIYARWVKYLNENEWTYKPCSDQVILSMWSLCLCSGKSHLCKAPVKLGTCYCLNNDHVCRSKSHVQYKFTWISIYHKMLPRKSTLNQRYTILGLMSKNKYGGYALFGFYTYLCIHAFEISTDRSKKRGCGSWSFLIYQHDVKKKKKAVR